MVRFSFSRWRSQWEKVPEGRMRALAACAEFSEDMLMALLSPEQLERARRLRRQDVACERRLWGALRGRRLNGLKFVRQLPIGPFIVDFACREARLVVEVDGAKHSTDDEVAYDAARTAFLERQGWKVMRVWNDDVVRGLDGVLESILRDCATR